MFSARHVVAGGVSFAMKTPLAPTVLAYCVLLLPPLWAQTLYVMPGKQPGGSGTRADPFRDPHQAVAAAEALRNSPARPEVTVVFGGGTYHLAKPLSLGAGAPGTALPDRQLTLRSESGQRAVFSLGTLVPLSAFAPVTDAGLLARMAPEARGKIVRLELASHGIAMAAAPDNFGGHEWLEVIQDGARLPLARWPNQGYARMGEVLDKGLPPSRTGGTFRYRDDRADRWQAAAADGQLWLRGFWRVPWTRQAMRVAELNPKEKSLTLARPIPARHRFEIRTEERRQTW